MARALNYVTFETHARKFVEMSDKLEDGWKIVNSQDAHSDVPMYLEKKTISYTEDTTEEKADISLENPGTVDSKEFQVPGSRNYLSATYHVIFSDSYQVPVLYFKITRPDGRQLSLEEIWQRVPDTYRSQFEALKWTMLTQQEHPILGQPYQWLHPCHTETLMKTWDFGHWNYLVTWLSSVGPVVGLNLKPEYAKLNHNL